MTYPSSLPTAHKTATKQCCGRAVGRGDIVGKSRLLRAFYSALALLVLLSQATVLVAAPREISLVPFDIPRQSADDSLPAFGQQANVTVVYLFDGANSHHSNLLYRKHTLKKGNHNRLKNSGL
ncbi:MAG: hypothetical protein HOO01_05715, partial [Cellvibrionales bacterium]|nr:hypothetical protein [Cellvibrionales bacterium]